MSFASGATILLAFLIAQTATTSACPPDNQGSVPVAPVSDVPTGETFTTTDGVRFGVETMVAGLDVPWSMAFAPDGRLFVTERPGRVRIVNLTARTSEVALTLTDVYTHGEAGMLGLALDPSFAQTHLVYLYYSARVSGGGAVNRVVRYREAGSSLGERAVLLDGIPAAQVHDGGRIRFGPDGLLYITAGDAAQMDMAQDAASLAGKFLRLNPDGTTPRANPFGSPIYTYGHRNPQGFDWHPVTGELWAVEHGNIGNDEINVIDAGANYGWPTIEDGETQAGMRGPIAFYSPAIAPSGASFYRGTRFPRFTNNFFAATLRGSHLLRLVVDPSSRTITGQERLLENRFGRIRDVVSGPDGYLYFCTNNRDGRGTPMTGDDHILRIVPAS